MFSENESKELERMEHSYNQCLDGICCKCNKSLTISDSSATVFQKYDSGLIPLEIAFHISAYISTVTSCGSPICTSLSNGINDFSNSIE